MNKPTLYDAYNDTVREMLVRVRRSIGDGTATLPDVQSLHTLLSLRDVMHRDFGHLPASKADEDEAG